jgi:hypothetical protein
MAMGSGEACEAAVLQAFVTLGFPVLLPFGASLPFDLAVQTRDGAFVRVQCKTGRRRDGCVVFNSCSTDHGSGRRDYRDRADVFGVWCQATSEVYVLPVELAATRATRLRLTRPANGRRRGVRWAADHLIDRWAASAAARAPRGAG